MERHRTFIMTILALLLVLVGLVSSQSLPPAGLQGAGATLPVSILVTGTPLTPSWINSFQTLSGGLVACNYNPSGSGAGQVAILGGQVDFAISSFPLSPTDMMLANNASALVTYPILLGALDLTYSFPAGTIMGTLNLTADILSSIFQGLVTSWNASSITAINPYLTYAGPIYPFARSDSSGATKVFANYLNVATVNVAWKLSVDLLVSWPAGVTAVNGDSSLVKGVGATIGAIGYTNYGSATAANLPSARLQNADGFFVTPSQITITAAATAFENSVPYPAGTASWAAVTLANQPGTNTWPLAHYEFALFYQDLRVSGPRGAALAGFMNYVVSSGAQSISPQFKYVPLSTAVIGTNLATLNNLLIAPGYSVTSYWNPYPPPPVYVSPTLLPGTIASLVAIGIFGGIILLGIVIFSFLEWRSSDVEFL